MLGIQRSRTSSYHQASSRTIERWHRLLHDGMSHYINSSHSNWDLVLPLLIAYRATPHSITGYSPFFLLHGWEIILPSNENVRAKVPKPNSSYNQQIERLKSGLKQAYESVSKASGKSHQANVVMIVEQRIATLRHETMCTCTSLQEGKVYPKNSIVPGRGRLKLQPKYI